MEINENEIIDKLVYDAIRNIGQDIRFDDVAVTLILREIVVQSVDRLVQNGDLKVVKGRLRLNVE